MLHLLMRFYDNFVFFQIIHDGIQICLRNYIILTAMDGYNFI
jgi:hypothetical protein